MSTSVAVLPYIVAPAVLEVTGTSDVSIIYPMGDGYYIDGFGSNTEDLPFIVSPGSLLHEYAESVVIISAVSAAGFGYAYEAIQLPLITGTGEGSTSVTSTSGQDSLVLPHIVATGAGLPGAAGGSAETLPENTAFGSGPPVSIAVLPRVHAASAGLAGVRGRSADSVPFVGTAGAGISEQAGTSTSTLLMVQAASSGLTGSASLSSVVTPYVSGAASGMTGVVGTAVLTLPLFTASSVGGVNATGVSVTVLLPVVVPRGAGFTDPGDTFTTVAMHAELQALSTYSSFPYNSMAEFEGVYLGAGDGGLFLLSGANDNGTPIAARAATGTMDFDTLKLKRVDRMYVGYRTNGNMVLRVTTDGLQVRDYALKATGKTDVHGNFVRMGKGVEAQYFQFEWRNVAGSDFSFGMMEVKPTVLRRRVSGNRA